MAISLPTLLHCRTLLKSIEPQLLNRRSLDASILSELVLGFWSQQAVEHARDVTVRGDVVGLGARRVAIRVQCVYAVDQALLMTCRVDALVLLHDAPRGVLSIRKRGIPKPPQTDRKVSIPVFIWAGSGQGREVVRFVDVLSPHARVVAHFDRKQVSTDAHVLADSAGFVREIRDGSIDAYVAVAIFPKIVRSRHDHPSNYQIGAENLRVITRAILLARVHRRVSAVCRKPKSPNIKICVSLDIRQVHIRYPAILCRVDVVHR
mmetsp:Transcript_22747/g.42719  ORF Transcript_22747/g.42719 Transcript_22747/m.42719 type:complete len:263 (-) Transcript_22747:120-908(-)